jgi:hypothetical protein
LSAYRRAASAMSKRWGEVIRTGGIKLEGN